MTNQPKTTKRNNKKENAEKKLVIASPNLFIFNFQIIIDYFSSGSKFKRFYRFKDKAKLPIGEQAKNSKNMDTSNSSQFDELLLKNMNYEEKKFYEEEEYVNEDDSKEKKTTIDSEKENKNEKELEFEKYFVPVERDNDNANYEEEIIIEEKFLKLFSSKGDKEIDILEISLESFLLTLN